MDDLIMDKMVKNLVNQRQIDQILAAGEADLYRICRKNRRILIIFGVILGWEILKLDSKFEILRHKFDTNLKSFEKSGEK